MGRVSLKCGVIRLPRLFFVARASVFRRNRTKTAKYCQKIALLLYFYTALLPYFHINLGKLRLKTFRFSGVRLKFFVLSLFPRSVYVCTPLARQPRISAPNPFARASVLFAEWADITRRGRISLLVFLVGKQAFPSPLPRVKFLLKLNKN